MLYLQESSKASFVGTSMCVFFQFLGLMSGFSAYLYFWKRKSDDKTEWGAAACWRLHPGSVGSVCSLIFQSFKRRSRSPHDTTKKHIIRRDAFRVTPAPICHPDIGASAASGGKNNGGKDSHVKWRGGQNSSVFPVLLLLFGLVFDRWCYPPPPNRHTWSQCFMMLGQSWAIDNALRTVRKNAWWQTANNSFTLKFFSF